MNNINLLLVLSIAFCYTGIGFGVHHSFTSPNVESHHDLYPEGHKQKVSEKERTTRNHKSIGAIKHEISGCCHYMLPNAPHTYDFDSKSAFLHLIAVNVPAVISNKVFDNLSFLAKNRERDPPEIFLSNSSLLL